MASASRAIETYLEDPLSENILNDMFAECEVVDVRLERSTPDERDENAFDEPNNILSSESNLANKLADLTPERT